MPGSVLILLERGGIIDVGFASGLDGGFDRGEEGVEGARGLGLGGCYFFFCVRG